ncbi:hypothetical protein MVEN_00613800 [Mycena venus]|uniref:Uncharacterized protein n=1 Tax=Mycena venus TaxID=2733690 RepID=A0A8H6YPU8_9AGAR|nr:hypothetical protein MVEN_00613800 [Mycena venus]
MRFSLFVPAPFTDPGTSTSAPPRGLNMSPAPVDMGTERLAFASIAAAPEYSQWSHGELRLSLLRADEELSSARIFAGVAGSDPSTIMAMNPFSSRPANPFNLITRNPFSPTNSLNHLALPGEYCHHRTARIP